MTIATGNIPLANSALVLPISLHSRLPKTLHCWLPTTPDLVLFKGVEELDGTEGSYTITFSNGPWTYSFENIADAEDEKNIGLFLDVLKNAKSIARYRCMQMK